MNPKSEGAIKIIFDDLSRINGEEVFNPWYQYDEDHDCDSSAPKLRRDNLEKYIHERLGRVKYLLIGESLGYKGGRFTGIPMVSERILLIGNDNFSKQFFFRTSKTSLVKDGFAEQTSSAVWNAVSQEKVDPSDVFTWNIFPYHPFNKKKGFLSNRTPSKSEFLSGLPILKRIIETLKPEKIIAIGNKAHIYLSVLGKDSYLVRHPSYGGIIKFKLQFHEIITKKIN